MVFITFYLVTSIIAGDFYKVPITVAFMVSSIYAIISFGGKPLMSRVNAFSRGAATEQMMLMIWIFVLAGAFAYSAKAMGSIDATVNLTLALLPPQMILAGMFLAACFVSISIGTSVGTIAALVPIAAGVASETHTDLAMMTAIIPDVKSLVQWKVGNITGKQVGKMPRTLDVIQQNIFFKAL